MRVSNHGGRCCGIKHIHGLPYKSTDMTYETNQKPVFHGPTVEQNNPGKLFSPGPYPDETGEARLVRLLAYVDRLRPQHLVEIVLSPYQYGHDWPAVLGKHGFRFVSEFTNSNTGCKLKVYHRTTPLP